MGQFGILPTVLLTSCPFGSATCYEYLGMRKLHRLKVSEARLDYFLGFGCPPFLSMMSTNNIMSCPTHCTSIHTVWDRALLGMSSPCWVQIEIWPNQPSGGRTEMNRVSGWKSCLKRVPGR